MDSIIEIGWKEKNLVNSSISILNNDETEYGGADEVLISEVKAE